MISIRAIDRTLTDGSYVYDVSIVDTRLERGIVLPAVTEADAIALCDVIAAAIEVHTNEEVVTWRTATEAEAPRWKQPTTGTADDEAPF